MLAPSMRAGAVRGRRVDALLVPSVRLSLAAVLAVNAGRLLLRAGAVLVHHPRSTAAAGAVLSLRVLLGWTGLVTVLVMAAVALACWRHRHRASFDSVAGGPLTSGWRGWWVYRRHWQPVMATAGLTVDYAGGQYVPRLHAVQCGACVDSLRVQLLAGQSPADYEQAAEAFAHTFAALACRVRVDRPGWVWLDLTHTDPLTTPVPALAVPDVPELDALPLGVTGDGVPWRLRLIGSHVLIAGATGSGKGSVLWSLVRSVAGGIRPGTVQVWAVDPKGGMELAFGAPLFARLAYRTTDDMLLLLEDAVAAMRHRQARLLGVTRLHTPTAQEPLIVVLVDELAALTAYVDRDTKRKAAELLQLLLSSAAPSGCSSSRRCRTRARTCCRSGICSPPGSPCGSPRTCRSTWSSVAEHGTGAPRVTAFPSHCPASATCNWKAGANPSASAPPTSPTPRCARHTHPRRIRR
ncbi:MAG: FtsK/SpoIIIE domain-containing protein [Actinomycetota bacterium]|nr:FtsK/SpoIIIE domain-containing protein [Actinomycetota bacterium]